MLGTHVHNANANAISHKVEEEGKPRGKNPPPKREMKKYARCMDGWSNQDPPLRHTSSIYKREEQNLLRGKIPPPPSPKKGEGDKVVPASSKGSMPNSDYFDEEIDPRL